MADVVLIRFCNNEIAASRNQEAAIFYWNAFLSCSAA